MDFVAEHINDNTIALVGSAGNYPYGTIDPIEQLSDLAVKHGIGLTKREFLSLEQSDPVIELQKRLKAVFDPAQILNPGKIFPSRSVRE